MAGIVKTSEMVQLHIKYMEKQMDHTPKIALKLGACIKG